MLMYLNGNSKNQDILRSIGKCISIIFRIYNANFIYFGDIGFVFPKGKQNTK